MSQLYPKGVDHLYGKATQVDVLTDTLKILFITAAIVTTNEFVSDLSGAAIVARSGALSGITLANGVVDANDVTVTAVSGSAFSRIIGYKDTGLDATSVLIASWDIPSFTPTGGDISVIWNASGLWSGA